MIHYFKSRIEAEDYFYKKSSLNFEYLAWGFCFELISYEVLFEPPVLGVHKMIQVMGVI